MKSKFTLVLLFSILIQESHGDIWGDFITQPNEIYYNNCQNFINNVIDDSSSSYLNQLADSMINSGIILKILEYTEKGDFYSANLCFPMFKILRGYPQYLEFIDISLGKFLRAYPTKFLSILNIYVNSSLSKYFDIGSIIGNYGDDYIDNNDSIRRETEARILILESVENRYLYHVRSICLDRLREKLDRYNQK